MSKPEIIAYCYANGVIKFRSAKLGLPKGALPIVRGPGKIVREGVSSKARHGYDGKTLLVPGVPEAPDQFAGVEALKQFNAWAVPIIEAQITKGKTATESADTTGET